MKDFNKFKSNSKFNYQSKHDLFNLNNSQLNSSNRGLSLIDEKIIAKEPFDKDELIRLLNLPKQYKIESLNLLIKQVLNIREINNLFPIKENIRDSLEEVVLNLKHAHYASNTVINLIDSRFESNYIILSGKITCIKLKKINYNVCLKDYLKYLVHILKHSHINLFRKVLDVNKQTLNINDNNFIELIEEVLNKDFIYNNLSSQKSLINIKTKKYSFISKPTIISKSRIPSNNSNLALNSSETKNKKFNNEKNLNAIISDYMTKTFNEKLKKWIIPPSDYLRSVNKYIHEVKENTQNEQKYNFIVYQLVIDSILEKNDFIGRFNFDVDTYKSECTYIISEDCDLVLIKSKKYKEIYEKIMENINKNNINIILESKPFNFLSKNDVIRYIYNHLQISLVNKGIIYSYDLKFGFNDKTIDLRDNFVIIKNGSISLEINSSLFNLQKYLNYLANHEVFNNNLQDYINDYDSSANENYFKNKKMIVKLETIERCQIIGFDEDYLDMLEYYKNNNMIINNLKNSYVSKNQSVYNKLGIIFKCESVNCEILIINKKDFCNSIINAYFYDTLLLNIRKYITFKRKYYYERIDKIIKTLKQNQQNKHNSTNYNLNTSSSMTHIMPKLEHNKTNNSKIKLATTKINKSLNYNTIDKTNGNANISDLKKYLDSRFLSYIRLTKKPI